MADIGDVLERIFGDTTRRNRHRYTYIILAASLELFPPPRLPVLIPRDKGHSRSPRNAPKNLRK